MKTLKSWNEERSEYWTTAREKVLYPERYGNGLECPTCHGELYDTGQVMNAGFPTVLRVRCMSQHCNFRGERLE